MTSCQIDRSETAPALSQDANVPSHPYPFELGTSSVFRLAVFGEHRNY